MGKQRGHRSNDPAIPGTRSVNPLGKSPDDKHAGEVISQGNEAAKKDNTK
ncbi:hypothetical protein MM300_22515 [Evansella sp. LMS18]|nr:hypothetical protein [Evansella sp. LMS18]UTR10602.1 hypothetical protein MM300_22515 [Evansella sp. LMS18]